MIALVLHGAAAIDGRAAPLDALLDSIAPETQKWASVVLVSGDPETPVFEWHHYRDSADAVDFWPASTIKIYAAVAAFEYLNELQMPTKSALVFESRRGDEWHFDAARTVPEMISEVFRRSSNEDYTLLFRFTGVDWINTRFLIPEKGFPHSALMRDYITHRPQLYENLEPQRITIHGADGRKRVVGHVWSGQSYSKPRGASVLSATTGNCTSTRELAECLRRVMFHESIPPEERYRLTADQLRLLREGGDGLVGLENRNAGAYAWNDAAETRFPKARFYHKGGWISSYCADVAFIDDSAHSGVRYIVAAAAATGDTETLTEICSRVAGWIGHPTAPP